MRSPYINAEILHHAIYLYNIPTLMQTLIAHPEVEDSVL